MGVETSGGDVESVEVKDTSVKKLASASGSEEKSHVGGQSKANAEEELRFAEVEEDEEQRSQAQSEKRELTEAEKLEKGIELLKLCKIGEDTDAIEELLLLGVPVDFKKPNTRRTPLMWAASKGNAKVGSLTEKLQTFHKPCIHMIISYRNSTGCVSSA